MRSVKSIQEVYTKMARTNQSYQKLLTSSLSRRPRQQWKKHKGVWVFALNTLTQLAQAVTSKNDSLAIRDWKSKARKSALKESKIWLFHLEIRGTSTLGESSRMPDDSSRMSGIRVYVFCVIRRSLELLFEIQGLLVHELILEFFSTFRFGEAVVDLDTARALQF
ncbi:hypothetical protein Tco_0989775 [Tanacetum coccineum]|uniref:Uncharacterized protein n=1 Tax=Tanacetum coccineum TaxID=301880 RepID=A0ABQ5EUJ9_9ASTR